MLLLPTLVTPFLGGLKSPSSSELQARHVDSATLDRPCPQSISQPVHFSHNVLCLFPTVSWRSLKKIKILIFI